jgi:hypothetical protein
MMNMPAISNVDYVFETKVEFKHTAKSELLHTRVVGIASPGNQIRHRFHSYYTHANIQQRPSNPLPLWLGCYPNSIGTSISNDSLHSLVVIDYTLLGGTWNLGENGS